MTETGIMAAMSCTTALVSDLVVVETAFDWGCSSELSTADFSEDRNTWDWHFGDSTSEFTDKSVPQSPGARKSVEPLCTSDWGDVGRRLSRVFHDSDREEDSSLEDFGSPMVLENNTTMADYGLSTVFKSFVYQGDSDDEDFESDPFKPAAMMNSGLSREFQNFQHATDDYDDAEGCMQAFPLNIPPPPGLTRDASAAAAAVALLGNTWQRSSVVAEVDHHENFSGDSSEDGEFDGIENEWESQEEESCRDHEESHPLLYTRHLSRVFAHLNLDEDADTAIMVDFAPDPMPNCKPPSFRPSAGLTRDVSIVAAAAAAKALSFGSQGTPLRTARPPH